MFARRPGSHTFLAIVALLASSVSLRAQDVGEVENAKYQISGKVNANAVYVRSGPSDNDYPVMQLSKDSEVTVVGERFNWLKILPPKDSFCFVSKAYVNRAGDGTVGQSTGTPYIRIGSALNQLKTKTAGTLAPNQRVEILGEQEEYFRIKPPAGVYMYVNKQFVDPVKQVPVANPNTPEPIMQSQTPEKPEPAPLATQNENQISANPTTTQPGAPVAENNAAPATQPAADAQSEFEKLEALYAQSSQRPIDEQPIAELLAGYKKLAASDQLPESMRRIAEFKVSALENRLKMQEDMVALKKIQEDGKSKQMALKTEQKELQERIDSKKINFYVAIGTLRTSSLQIGTPTLYRLTDPANGRTVVYLRSDDPKLGQSVGEFLGVKGEVVNDTQRNLTVITVTSFEAVSPASFGQTVVAQFSPPSLLPNVASGRDTGN